MRKKYIFKSKTIKIKIINGSQSYFFRDFHQYVNSKTVASLRGRMRGIPITIRRVGLGLSRYFFFSIFFSIYICIFLLKKKKDRKAVMSVCLSVRPSVREQNLYLLNGSIFLKTVKRFRFSIFDLVGNI